MSGIERLKRYWWYFAGVRSHDMMRQNIGLQDPNVSNLPRVNPKNKKITMGNSEQVMNRILEELPYQDEILRRWQRLNKVKNTTITGKVIFE